MMAKARDEAGNIWEVDAAGNQRLLKAAGTPSRMTIGTPDPYRPKEEARKDEDQAFERERLRNEQERLRLSQADAARATANLGLTQKGQRFTQASALRQDYDANPTVKIYNSILPTYAAALDSPPTAAGDYGMVYAVAKVMAADGSAVREGEVASTEKIQSWVDRIKGQYAKQVNGDGTFTDQARQEIRAAMAQKMVRLNEAYIGQRVRFKEAAERNGVDPRDVVGDHAGIPFQKDEAKFLGHDIATADYHGNVIATGNKKQGDIPPPMQGEFNAWIANNPNASPEAYAAMRSDLDAKYGYGGGGFSKYIEEAKARGIKGGNIPGPAVDTDWWERFSGSPVGTAVGTFANSATGGIPTLLAGQEGKEALDAVSAQNWKSALAGNLTGGTLSAFGVGKGLQGLGMGATAAGITGNIGYSTMFGANSADEGDRLRGGAFGLMAGGLGEGAGRYVVSPVVSALAKTQPAQEVANVARSLIGRDPANVIPAVSAPQKALADASGAPFNAIAQAAEAQSLGLPFLPVDASTGLTTLAGAATRRSPVAKALAEETLLPRARGQIDRLGSAMERDFGPGTNIPERSEALIRQARTDAAPLYEQAMSQPGAGNIDLSDLSQRPSWRPSIANARRIAAEEGRDPTALGFDLNDQGEVVLTRVPSYDTLDLVKQGMDDIIEGYRDPVTGRVNLDRFGRAVDNSRRDLVGRLDERNEFYAPARQAYAGPAGEREALNMGRNSLSQPPDTIKFTLRDMPANRQAQYRLGMREGLEQRAEAVRYASNPYNSVAGSPAMDARLSILNPETAPQFIRQAELEGQMARTHNQVLGNSMTAERQIADESLATGPAANAVADALIHAGTGSPITAGVSVARALSGDNVRGYFATRAAGKANAVAEALFGMNPETALIDAYRASRTRRVLGADLQRAIDPIAVRLASAPAYPALAAQ